MPTGSMQQRHPFYLCLCDNCNYRVMHGVRVRIEIKVTVRFNVKVRVRVRVWLRLISGPFFTCVTMEQ